MSSLNIKRTLKYQKLDVHRQIDALKKKKKKKIVQRQTYTIPLKTTKKQKLIRNIKSK